MKKFLTMWRIWAGISIVLVIVLITRADSLSGLVPFALILICPLMMLFMMGGHKHK